ncbi:MAG: hypothetical protein IPJ34_41410 [Myxococcales bacterium]|nr:hypothetical protein [Myxococcales bacterium]
MLRETFLDGCVGETLGSLQLAAAASACTHPALARVLAEIAEDEARHAELAFRIVAFLLRAHPDLVDELRALARDVPIGAVPPRPTCRPSACSTTPTSAACSPPEWLRWWRR